MKPKMQSKADRKAQGSVAGTFFRTLAYAMDIFLALLLAMVLLSLWILPRYHGLGLEVLQKLRGSGLQLSSTALASLSKDEQMALLRLLGTFQWVTMAVIFFHFFLGEMLGNGSSIGKRIFRMRVVSNGPNRPYNALLICSRTMISTVCAMVLFPFLAVNFIVALFRKDRRCIHDLLTGTWVVRLM
ncbi:MAG: RDD family protein [Puniceicoccales bacterium]|jgi:uncharacterized RDD family membrane protein YckC|nr:RDD family protein [Puniceicoccales bacterium]